MEIKITEERANALLSRKEYRVEIAHARESSPKRAEVRKEFAKAISVPADRIVIEHMEAQYGVPLSRGVIHAYDSDSGAKATVRHHILVRNGLAQKKGAKPAEKPAENASAEKKEA